MTSDKVTKREGGKEPRKPSAPARTNSSSRENDESFLQHALARAREGVGLTSPNPCVGAVIVSEAWLLSNGPGAVSLLLKADDALGVVEDREE